MDSPVAEQQYPIPPPPRTWPEDTLPEPPPLPKPVGPERDFASLIQQEASRHGFDPALGMRLVARESSNNPYKVNAGSQAAGLMQIIPRTAEQLGVAEPKVPAQAVPAGFRYLSQLRDQFAPKVPQVDPVELALAAYNWGPGRLQKMLSKTGYDFTKLPRETRDYINNILHGQPIPPKARR